MTSFLSPTHTDTFMATQDNEALTKQQASATQNAQAKPGSRERSKETNPIQPGSRDKKDQPSLSSPQIQLSNKKDPSANMLNFHKYSQITKQNQDKKVEKKEKEKEQRERERELQQKNQPVAQQQAKAQADKPLEGVITLADYFEKMQVNKRSDPAQ